MQDRDAATLRALPVTIDRLTIKGFKSLAGLHRFPLAPLNILIGENGSSKNDCVTFFDLLG